MVLDLNRDNYRTYRAYRDLLKDKLTELALYAKELCPDAVVEVSATSYEDEDGHVDIFPPPGLPKGKQKSKEAVGARQHRWRAIRWKRG